MSSVTQSSLPDPDDRLYLRDMVEFCESVPALLRQLRVTLATLPPAI